MAITISLVNMKGGVRKSILAANLAWIYAGYGAWNKRVLDIDLDPQFNVSQYLLGAVRYKRLLDAGMPTMWDGFEQFSKVPGPPRPNLRLVRRCRTLSRGEMAPKLT